MNGISLVEQGEDRSTVTVKGLYEYTNILLEGKAEGWIQVTIPKNGTPCLLYHNFSDFPCRAIRWPGGSAEPFLGIPEPLATSTLAAPTDTEPGVCQTGKTVSPIRVTEFVRLYSGSSRPDMITNVGDALTVKSRSGDRCIATSCVRDTCHDASVRLPTLAPLRPRRPSSPPAR